MRDHDPAVDGLTDVEFDPGYVAFEQKSERGERVFRSVTRVPAVPEYERRSALLPQRKPVHVSDSDSILRLSAANAASASASAIA